MTARPVKVNELPQLLSIAIRTFVDTYAHLNDPSDFDAYLKENFTIERIRFEFDTKGSQFYFIENENNILGFVKLNFDKTPFETSSPVLHQNDVFFKENKGVEIERIYVLPEHKGNGIGRFIVETVENLTQNYTFSENEQSKIDFQKYIWLGVWSENSNAMAFYEKVGFIKFGEHIFRMGSDDQIDFLMFKKLK